MQSWLSLMKVPLSTICAHSTSYSSCEPSTQWMASGWVSAAIFWTHLRRCSFFERGFELAFADAWLCRV